MKKIILFGHTGSINRGCDAIVKSTADLFHDCGGTELKVCLVTSRKSEDSLFGFEEYDKIIESAGFENAPIRRLASLFVKKVLHKSIRSCKIRFKTFEKELDEDTIVLVVGGDTYCYGQGVNELYKYVLFTCKKHKVPCVLWACSVEKNRLKSNEYINHFNEYDLICAREQLTFDYFIDAGFSTDKVRLMCDPAFSLKIEKVELPQIFIKGKVIGINISNVVLDWSNNAELLMKNVYNLIDDYLAKDSYYIALIPHVYTAGKETRKDKLLYGRRRQYDTDILSQIKAHYEHDERVFLIDKFYNSKQLKYIISNCYILVTARTHASIAAYSSSVPTIVIGYSVKADGLAVTLFGETNNYIVNNKDLHKESEILEAVHNIESSYEEIKNKEKRAVIELNSMNTVTAKYIIDEFCH